MNNKNRNLGKGRTIETENYIITYDITDESFAHAFGTETQYGYEVTSVLLYVPAMDEFIDEDHIYTNSKDEGHAAIKKKISSMVDNAIDSDIGSNGYYDDIEEFQDE